MIKAAVLAGAAVMACATFTAASAQETGLASIHSMRREGGRICMSDHFHHGSSKGQKSRKLAEDEAIRSWASFTAFEYGETWANFKIAGSKQMNCGPEGGAWGCTTSARPCKAAGPQRKGKS